MVSLNRQYGHLYEQVDYDCQRCGAPETEAMRKRVHDFARPYCDDCSEALKHEGHGPGSGLMVGRQHTELKVNAEGRLSEKTTVYPDVPIEEWPTRCRVCFGKDLK